MMRLLTILSLIAAALWSGWWFVGSTAAERGTKEGIQTLRTQGWTVDYDTLDISGFPNRFDTQATSVDIATPDRLWGATLPILQVFALSYRPNEVIVVPAPSFQAATPLGPVDITSTDLRASAALTVSTTPDIARATAVGQSVSATGTVWSAAVDRGQVAIRQAETDTPNTYDLALSLTDLELDGVAHDPRIPSRFSSIEMDALTTLDRPMAQDGTLVSATIRQAQVRWDGIDINLTGDVGVGPSGLLSGQLTMRLQGWRDLIPLATQMGMPPMQTALLSGGLAGLETDGTAEVPLTLRDGVLLFGTIPLAALPRLRPPHSP